MFAVDVMLYQVRMQTYYRKNNCIYLKKLEKQESEISKDLKEKFRVRINEHWSYDLIHLWKYFKKPDYIYQPQDQLEHKIHGQKKLLS